MWMMLYEYKSVYSYLEDEKIESSCRDNNTVLTQVEEEGQEGRKRAPPEHLATPSSDFHDLNPS